MEPKLARVAGLVLLVLGMVVGGYRALRSSPAEEGAAAASGSAAAGPVALEAPIDRGAALSRQVDRLREEVEALRSDLAALRTEVSAIGDPEPEQAVPTDEEELALTAEQLTLVEAEFNGEATDPRWARESTALIQQAIAEQPGLRDAAQGMECRSKSCRLELRLDDQTESEISALVHTLAPHLPVVRHDYHDEGGRKTQVLYLASQPSANHDEG